MVLGLWFESARAMLFLFILLNALPVPMLRQVSQNRCFTCMGALFRSNMGRHLQTPFWDHFWLHFGVILESLNVVEAAPQARPKTTAAANTALRQSPCSPPSFNALPVPMLRQVSVFSCLDLQNSAPMQVKLIFSRK